MLFKSRCRALGAFASSAMLAMLPLAVGCQSANFSGSAPGFGWVSGWWGGKDASKIDPDKPPASYLPSSKADPNGDSYAGGSARGAKTGYDSGASGYGSRTQGAGEQGAAYATGGRTNMNNWGGANRKTTTSPGYGDSESSYASTGNDAGAKGYGASAGREKPSAGYDPYGGESPTDEGMYADRASAAAYSADARGSSASAARGATGGYSNRMASATSRATRGAVGDESGYGASAADEDASSTGGAGNRFSTSGGYGAKTTARGARSASAGDEAIDSMTADEDSEASYPQTTGYGSGYKVPPSRGAAPSNQRRYPSTSKSTDDDYGMSEGDGVEAEYDVEESPVQKVSATASGRYGLSSKAAAMLDRSGEGDFRPGSTSRSAASDRVSPANYTSDEAEESAEEAEESTASRFSRG